MDNLRERRRTEITITNTGCRKLLNNKYIFNDEGDLITDFGSMTPSWLLNKLQKAVYAQPHISGTELISITSPEDDTVFATAMLERYIDITLPEILDINADRFPNKEAVADRSADTRLSYAELKQQSDQLAKQLISLGVAKGDTIALVMLNCFEQLIAKYSILKTGAVIDNISPYEKMLGLKTLLQRTDATVLIVKPGVKAEETIDSLYEICPELRTALPGELHAAELPLLRAVIVAGTDKTYPGTLSFRDLLAATPQCTDRQLEKRLRSISYRDIATIIHTSGTTNIPKSVMLTHGTISENAFEHMRMLGLDETDRIFTPVPIFHSLGCIGSCITALIAGATVVMIGKQRLPQALEVLAEERCTAIFAVPSYYIGLIEEIKHSDFDTSRLCLRLCVLAGAECLEKTILDIQTFLGADDVLVMYGMTEAGPGITSTNHRDSLEVKANTVGKPWPGVSIKLIDEYRNGDGRTCGEICVHGYNIMKGYYNDQAATACAIDRDGWLHTGDIGCIRPDGNLVICGRVKDIITRNGENISPKEVECFLKTHPNIAEVYVVGAKDYKCGEDIYAFVKLERGQTATEQELLDYCRGKIATIKIPSHICFVDNFLKSNSGKVLRKELRKVAQDIHNSEKL